MFQDHRLIGFVLLAVTVALPEPAQAQCQTARLVASDAQERDEIGTSVAVSGDWGMVASTDTDDQGPRSGSVYVTHRGPSGWTFVDKLLASDGTTSRVFGADVKMEGDHALIGSNYGAYAFERGPGGWTEVQRLLGSDTLPGDGFGRALCMNGDRALITATVKDSQGVPHVGVVYVFERGPGGWVETARLESPDPAAEDHFGSGLALGDDVAIVGAPFRNLHGFHNKGIAYVFERTGNSWSLAQTLSIYAGNDGDSFGGSIALHRDRIAITAPGEESIPVGVGAVHVYQRTPAGWVHEARLIPDGPIAYGFALHGLDMSADKVFVTGYLVGDQGEQGGRIVVYKRTAAGWRFEHRFGENQPHSGGLFGTAVSVSGDTILVGARGSGDICDDHTCNSGAAFMFDAPLESAHNICSSMPNSSGEAAVISLAGCTSIGMNEMSLIAQPTPAGVPGVFFYGDSSLTPVPFGDGLRCVGGQVYRLRPGHALGTTLSSTFDHNSAPQSAGHITAGSTWYFQAYYRDPAGAGAGFNSSDAIEVLFKN